MPRNVQTTAQLLVLHTSKVMIKILQARLQQYLKQDLPDVQVDLEKAEELESKYSISVGSQKSKRVPEKPLLLPYWLYQILWLCGSHSWWKILQEVRIPDHLTCLLRNQYTGQEATVRTRHRTTDWFQIGKGVSQCCILSPCLFNLYAEYIIENARLYEAQLVSRLPEEISITSETQMTPPLWQKVNMN